MNENPEVASSWKGRILLRAEAYETDKPVAKTVNVDQARLKDPEYQAALEALDGSASREFRYVETI